MRYVLTAALAAALVLPAGSSAAGHHAGRHSPERLPGHVSLHLSGHDLLVGHDLTLRGRVRPAGRHLVRVVVRGHSTDVLATRTGASGRFRVRLPLVSPGLRGVRAYVVHDRHTRGSASPVRRLTVYRPAMASYYGPGLYGHGVACGGTLMPGTLGVASPTLPCGTKVRLRYHGRSLTVPVIDRGPYVGGRVYDLTTATKERLGFPGLGIVLSSR